MVTGSEKYQPLKMRVENATAISALAGKDERHKALHLGPANPPSGSCDMMVKLCESDPSCPAGGDRRTAVGGQLRGKIRKTPSQQTSHAYL
jgi:hypothetical protein